ncbi:uncharacterized protein LOC110433003 isoform X2 [Sorghum bicolor]|uniref:uncharacterized protein LOC110433003 isoform X2 n=1 Tax=Sorghum bicolor TaxID=4558 RepID=UPI0001C809E3|nr:uncharacterized protein LOC110433003 isoform X2 [Sorghum bicolor]|eukprot:XP_021310153.1 uncharacterized protein LOC110433003 isoform X2 [Sorghum bicolor]
MMKLKSRRLLFYKDVEPEDCHSGSGHPHLTAQAKFAAMNMQTEDVKTRRPVQVKRSRWVLGDVTEVLDHNSWRLGKITEVLKNDCFVIRLAGCIQPREFHISCLRIPHDSKQLTVGDRDHQAYEEVDHYAKRKAANICASTGARAVKRKLEASRIPPNDLVRRTGKERKVAAYEFRQLTKNELPLKVSARNAIDGDHFHRSLSSRYNDLTKNISDIKPVCKFLPLSEKPLRVREENECSVASCSANYSEYSTSDNQQSVGIGNSFPDDVMSACQSGQEIKNTYGSGLFLNVHELELQAYQSTVRAFHAAGPLTWEQESLLTNLRLSLNISNEEHLLQLRHLLSI